MPGQRFFDLLSTATSSACAEWFGRLKRDWEAGRLLPSNTGSEWVPLAETDGQTALQFSVVLPDGELPLLTVTSSGDLHNEEFDRSGGLTRKLKQRYGGDGLVVELDRLYQDGDWFRTQFSSALQTLTA